MTRTPSGERPGLPRPWFASHKTAGVNPAARRAVVALVLLAGAVVAAPDIAPPPRAVPDAGVQVAPMPRAVVPVVLPVPDAQEVVVFAPNRPVRVRLTIRYEGRPAAEMWRTRLRLAFDHFDRDRDGFLGGKEVGRIFSDTGMGMMLQNGFYQPTPQDIVTLDRLDADKDGRVSFAEFAAYYKTATAQVLRGQPVQPENPFNAGATEALFKLLDVNGDGKLTKDEVRAAEALLATKDADEDECLSLAELVPNPPPARQGLGGGGFPATPNGTMSPPPTLPGQTVMVFESGRIPGTVTQQILKRYDADGDFELTRDESGFDAETFARLDADSNGRLDGEEIDAWRTGPADLEVSLSLASKAVECAAKVTTDREAVTDRGFRINQVEPGRVVIRTGRQPIEFWAYAPVTGPQQPALKQQYAYLFTQAAGMRGVVQEKDLTGPNAVQFQFLRTLFEPADADGDGTLTKAEFDAYFDLQDVFRNTPLAVTPAVQTPTLFQLLDENRDGRLGVRELRTAWDRLIALEPAGGGVVTRNAILPSVSMRLTRGQDRFLLGQVQYQPGNPNQVQLPQKGPVWFRRMDRNADGDVSRPEFLGTRAEFDAIDTDKDGLVSLPEAETWDKAVREKK